MLKKILFTIFSFLSVLAFSQVLGSKLDKKTLALGEVGIYKVNISNLQGKDVQSSPKNELLPFHFETVKDSISKQMDMYERTVEFQIFEEGKFTIPALDFKIGDQLYHTIPYEVEVINTAQKGDQINDIMKNKEVKLDVKDYWELYKWYILGILTLLALIFIIWNIVKYAKRRKSSPVMMTNQTLKDLEKLRKKKFIENGDFRMFYVELIDISRNFITKQYKIPADVLLTDDLIDVMKLNNTISPQNEKIVEEVFVRGDLVKFAKTFPDQQTMSKDFEDIKNFVKRSSKDLEAEQLRTGV
ncbi:BatD family protein [Chryseobacterium suipulveris]|uniref:BatD family protein n=1 Tax=Chryseobacterium suipulveris TaxID=2929800 RepID=A0ABY4BT90_9FLAO|nr:BatD family protein [Chryseobacterium suipulveris]UOE42428.1 BatD family protein [Chryseobacterium suipulveris]